MSKLRYPLDAHRLPRVEGNYICFPDWMRRVPFDLGWRVGAWIGETFNAGRYCFTVDRNREPEGC